MNNLIDFLNNEIFISILVWVMWVFVSFIIGIASYLVWTNININPNINWLQAKRNYSKLWPKIKNVLELKKWLLENHWLFGLYVFILLSFFCFLYIIIQNNDILRIFLIALLLVYAYIFLRVSYIIVKILNCNLDIDNIYYDLMDDNIHIGEDS